MTVQVADYSGQADVLFKQAKVILEREHTPEEFEQANKMVTDAKQLQTKAFLLTDISKAASDAVEHEDKGRPKGSDKFSDWQEFVTASVDAYRSGYRKVDPRLKGWNKEASESERKDLVENVGASGGFLVPTEFYNSLMAVDPEMSIVRSRATKIRMARRQIDIPVLSQVGTTAGSPHWYGGMTWVWTEEAAVKTETEPAFRKIALVAHKLAGYTHVSDELLADSAISLGDFFNSSLGFAGGVAWMEDYAFLRGTGGGQPQGVLNAGATITVARTGTTTPIVYADIVNMLEAFLPSGRGVWVVNQTGLSNLLQMTVGTSNVWQPNMQAGVPGTLFGMPVIFTEKLPAVGTAGDVLLADFRYYLIGDRQATTIESTPYTDKFIYDLTTWRVVHRVDGQPWLSAPLTYQDGTVQVSPFVILGDKST